jgi:hypothetical protein
MIKASEALEITVEKAADLIEKDIVEVEKAVYRAANKGSAYCIYSDELSRQTQDFLKQLGYSVRDYSNQKDGPTYRIQWDGRA